jgi:lycopene cyclase domain-containing protein
MTYFVVSAVFLGVALLVLATALWLAPDRRALLARWWLPVLAAGIVVAVLTAVFDNLMIHIGLMEYSRTTTSGLKVGLAPLEDFSYPLAGLILLPALWLLLRRRERSER